MDREGGEASVTVRTGNHSDFDPAQLVLYGRGGCRSFGLRLDLRPLTQKWLSLLRPRFYFAVSRSAPVTMIVTNATEPSPPIGMSAKCQ